jgi:hypothetical protein
VLHLLASQEGLSLLDLVTVLEFSVGWDSVVGVATHYRLDSLGIKSSRVNFLHPSRQVMGPTQSPLHWVLVFSPVKQPGHGIDHQPPCSAEVKERVELYIYCLFGPSWSVPG